jgi:hypothetical protein
LKYALDVGMVEAVSSLRVSARVTGIKMRENIS